MGEVTLREAIATILTESRLSEFLDGTAVDAVMAVFDEHNRTEWAVARDFSGLTTVRSQRHPTEESAISEMEYYGFSNGFTVSRRVSGWVPVESETP